MRVALQRMKRGSGCEMRMHAHVGGPHEPPDRGAQRRAAAARAPRIRGGAGRAGRAGRREGAAPRPRSGRPAARGASGPAGRAWGCRPCPRRGRLGAVVGEDRDGVPEPGELAGLADDERLGDHREPVGPDLDRAAGAGGFSAGSGPRGSESARIHAMSPSATVAAADLAVVVVAGAEAATRDDLRALAEQELDGPSSEVVLVRRWPEAGSAGGRRSAAGARRGRGGDRRAAAVNAGLAATEAPLVLLLAAGDVPDRRRPARPARGGACGRAPVAVLGEVRPRFSGPRERAAGEPGSGSGPPPPARYSSCVASTGEPAGSAGLDERLHDLDVAVVELARPPASGRRPTRARAPTWWCERPRPARRRTASSPRPGPGGPPRRSTRS